MHFGACSSGFFCDYKRNPSNLVSLVCCRLLIYKTDQYKLTICKIVSENTGFMIKELVLCFFFFFFSALDATVCPRILVSNCARYSHRIFPGYSVFNLLQDFYSRWILHRAYSLWFLWTQTFHHLSLKKIQTCTRLFIEASTLRRLLTNSNFPNSSLTSSPGTDLLLK